MTAFIMVDVGSFIKSFKSGVDVSSGVVKNLTGEEFWLSGALRLLCATHPMGRNFRARAPK